MDYCPTCRRHLNGALVCPGCGAVQPDGHSTRPLPVVGQAPSAEAGTQGSAGPGPEQTPHPQEPSRPEELPHPSGGRPGRPLHRASRRARRRRTAIGALLFGAVLAGVAVEAGDVLPAGEPGAKPSSAPTPAAEPQETKAAVPVQEEESPSGEASPTDSGTSASPSAEESDTDASPSEEPGGAQPSRTPQPPASEPVGSPPEEGEEGPGDDGTPSQTADPSEEPSPSDEPGDGDPPPADEECVLWWCE